MRVLYRFLALAGISAVIEVLPQGHLIQINPVLGIGIILLASSLLPELEKRL